jgi:hypothetical protein
MLLNMGHSVLDIFMNDPHSSWKLSKPSENLPMYEGDSITVTGYLGSHNYRRKIQILWYFVPLEITVMSISNTAYQISCIGFRIIFQVWFPYEILRVCLSSKMSYMQFLDLAHGSLVQLGQAMGHIVYLVWFHLFYYVIIGYIVFGFLHMRKNDAMTPFGCLHHMHACDHLLSVVVILLKNTPSP